MDGEKPCNIIILLNLQFHKSCEFQFNHSTFTFTECALKQEIRYISVLWTPLTLLSESFIVHATLSMTR